jgi:hypothetical protein
MHIHPSLTSQGNQVKGIVIHVLFCMLDNAKKEKSQLSANTIYSNFSLEHVNFVTSNETETVVRCFNEIDRNNALAIEKVDICECVQTSWKGYQNGIEVNRSVLTLEGPLDNQDCFERWCQEGN